MKRYETYKDSGIQWLGDIPEHWKILKIKYILEASKDGIKIGPFGSSLTGKILPNGDYKVYGQWNIVDKDFSAGKNFVSLETYNNLDSYHVITGDILISMMGTVGKCAIIPNGIIPGIMDSHVVKVRLNIDVMSPSFFEFVYDKDYCNVVYGQIQKNRRGSIMDGLNSSVIKDFLIPIPPIIEQNIIVEYLYFKVGQINSLISAKEKQVEDLQQYRSSVISEAVTRGLNPDVEFKDSGVEWIGDIPKHWGVDKLKNICILITDGSHFSPKTIQDGGLPYITVSNVYSDSIHIEEALRISYDDFILLVKNGCQPESGDVLLSKDGTVGRSAIVEENNYVVLSSLGILRSSNLLISKYLKYSLDSSPLQEQMKLAMAGSALRRITIEKIKLLLSTLPPVEEQKIIISYLDEKTSKIDETIKELKIQIDDLRQYKKTVISEAVTGKVDLRDWKPK